MLDSVEIESHHVFEIETQCGNVVKLAIRIPHNDKCDMVLVLVRGLRWDEMTVKTAWLNSRNDNHRSLRRANYAHA